MAKLTKLQKAISKELDAFGKVAGNAPAELLGVDINDDEIDGELYEALYDLEELFATFSSDAAKALDRVRAAANLKNQKHQWFFGANR